MYFISNLEKVIILYGLYSQYLTRSAFILGQKHIIEFLNEKSIGLLQ